jgi:hypothetical protein
VWQERSQLGSMNVDARRGNIVDLRERRRREEGGSSGDNNVAPWISRVVPSMQMSEGRVPEAVVYPGAPLRAVAIEVGFSALLDALPRFGAFQRRHLAEFGHLYETSADERESLPDGNEFARPRTVVLMGRGRKRAVTVARDQLAIITYGYTDGFAGFMDWAMPMLREGLSDLGVERILGTSYRYENRIPHDTEKLDLGSLFRLSLATPAEAGNATRNVHMYWRQHWPEGTVEIDLDACPHTSPDEIHLNITARRAAQSGSMDEIETSVREAHRLARLTFEELITSRFRDQLRATST